MNEIVTPTYVELYREDFIPDVFQVFGKDGEYICSCSNEEYADKISNVLNNTKANKATNILQQIHDIAIDYDGYRTVEGLKRLIDEIRILASKDNND